MSVINTQPLIGASGQGGGYNIERSLRFRSSASAQLSRTPTSTGNRKTWTWSGWVKLGTPAATTTLFSCGVGSSGSASTGAQFLGGTNELQIYDYTTTYNFVVNTANMFRDPAAWYHIVIAFDTTQATAANRIKTYINGVQATYTSPTYPALNTDYQVNNTVPHNIGRFSQISSVYFDGYMGEVNFIDGQALAVSSFGEFDTITSVWKPKRYAGTYGTNGFYLPFTDIATTSGSNAGLGKDFSSNGNYWNTSNISVTAGTTYDSMTDVPTLTSPTAGNYCVVNPLLGNWGGSSSDGNLKVTNTIGNWAGLTGTMGMSSGKWYWEVTPQNVGEQMHGIVNATKTVPFGWVGDSSVGYGYYNTTGNKYNNNAAVAYGAVYTINDIIGVAYDADNGTLTFYKNNASQGVAYSSIPAGTYVPGFSMTTIAGANTAVVNFGQRPFAYTPPTGFKALNTYNLSDSTIVAGNTNFNTTVYTGDGTNFTTLVSSGFPIGLSWIKNRSVAVNHNLYDVVRNASLEPNTTGTEFGQLIIPSGNGFYPSSDSRVNQSGQAFVQWAWKSGTSAVTNTSGTISSTVSANPTAGFSIVTFTSGSSGAATIGHGLGVIPNVIIVKDRGQTGNWAVYHSSTTTSTSLYLLLNSTAATSTISGVWGSALPTSSVFGITSGTTVQANDTCVAYCWAEVPGFSKFGSYAGNGSADGPFIYTGFRPKFVMYKQTNATGPWIVMDSSRGTTNVIGPYLVANDTITEASVTIEDFLSNGFKIRSAAVGINGSSDQMIYMAFAENPFKNSLAR